jgi:putative flavoprotein involved in K+ transport
VHERGVTQSPGSYFLGLTWQHTRGSALIGFVKDDGAHIAEQVRAYARPRGTGCAGASRVTTR